MPAMSSKERVLAALAHQETDRVPFSMGLGITPEATDSLIGHRGLESRDAVYAYLRSLDDMRAVGADYVGRKDRCITLPGGGYRDAFGVERTPVSYGMGHYNEISYYPLAEAKTIADLDKHELPLAEWWDVSGVFGKIRTLNAGGNEYGIKIANGNIFESAWYMRGFERMLSDFYENPELAYELMRRVTDYLIAYFRRILEAAGGMVDLVFTADDLGGQEGLLISPSMWERMIKPHHVRLNKALHEYGVKVLYHSDGAVFKLLPGLIDMGIDILEAVQTDAAGMDPAAMKEGYGDALCFHGGVSVQKTLPFGSVEDVLAEVAMLKRVLGKGGGYILAPAHAIQAGTPADNIFAFLDEAVLV